MRKSKHLLLTVVVVAAVAVVAACTIRCVRHTRRHRLEKRIDNLIQAYERNHATTTLNKLASFLNQRAPTPAQGSKILSYITQMETATRSSYPTGRPANIVVNISRTHPLNNLVMWQRVKVFHDVKLSSTGHRPFLGAGSYGIIKLDVTHLPQGTHILTIEHSATVLPYEYETLWSWPSRRPFPACLLPSIYKIPQGVKEDKILYELKTRIPLSITLVNPSRAEKVELLTNPTLDKQVTAAFKFKAEPPEPVSDFLSDQMTYPTYVHVSWQPLPCDVIASVYFRKADGARKLFAWHKGRTLQIKAGAPGETSFYCTSVMLEGPASYSGKVVIQPDADLAYRDPRIKTIWAGTIEFPVTITVTEK